MEFRVALQENKLSELAARDLAVDYAEFYLDQFFDEDRELLLPLDFAAYEFGEFVVYARGDVTSPKLESWADAILEAGETVEEPSDD